ncbi:unnamed protein product [Closterium sp. NIES-64]|nr:unnamed protein product [Closterium sp. NIES-64]
MKCFTAPSMSHAHLAPQPLSPHALFITPCLDLPGAKPTSLRVRLAVLVDVVDKLSFLNSCRIVHCDVKPAIMLLDACMRVSLV